MIFHVKTVREPRGEKNWKKKRKNRKFKAQRGNIFKMYEPNERVMDLIDFCVASQFFFFFFLGEIFFKANILDRDDGT